MLTAGAFAAVEAAALSASNGKISFLRRVVFCSAVHGALRCSLDDVEDEVVVIRVLACSVELYVACFVEAVAGEVRTPGLWARAFALDVLDVFFSEANLRCIGLGTFAIGFYDVVIFRFGDFHEFCRGSLGRGKRRCR